MGKTEVRSEYTIMFSFDMISSKSMVRRLKGEIDVNTDGSLQDLKNTENEKSLKDLIYMDIEPKFKKHKIFNIDIDSINPTDNKNKT